MEIRIQQIQEKLKKNKFSAAVLRLPENVVLFSQYWPRNGFSFVFIPAEGEASIVAPYGDGEDPFEGSIQDVKTFGWVRISDGDPYDGVYKHLLALAQKYNISENSKVAVEMNVEQAAPPLCSGEVLLPSLATYNVVKAALKTDQLVSVNSIIDEIRAVKTAQDIEKLQLCNKFALQGVLYFDELLKSGGKLEEGQLREIDVATKVESYIAQEALKNKNVRYCRVWAQVSSGLKTADAWFAGMVSSGRKIENGDFVMLEMATAIDGYWSDLTETTVCGEPSKKQAELLATVKKSQQLAIEGVHEGADAASIDRIARDFLSKEGLGKYFNHKVGHGVGFAYHESTPILAPDSKDVLKSGMVHSVEPGIYIPGCGGIRFEVNVLVEPKKGRVLGRK